MEKIKISLFDIDFKKWVSSNGPRIENITSITISVYAKVVVKVRGKLMHLPDLLIYKEITGPGIDPSIITREDILFKLLGIIKNKTSEVEVDDEIAEMLYYSRHKTPTGRLKRKIAKVLRKALTNKEDVIINDYGWANN